MNPHLLSEIFHQDELNMAFYKQVQAEETKAIEAEKLQESKKNDIIKKILPEESIDERD